MKQRVLAFGAHPDDIEIGCAGTEVKLQTAGYEIFHAILTSGDAGHLTLAKQELARIREQEALAASRVLQVQETFFLRYPDGLTGFSADMRLEIINLIRKLEPEIVFLHASADEFPDHRIAHQLIMSAIVGAAGPWFQNSLPNPHRVDRIYGYEVWHPLTKPQLLVNIDESIEKKMQALCCFPSQIQSVDYRAAAKALATYRGVTSMSGQYAEAFEVLRTSLSAELL